MIKNGIAGAETCMEVIEPHFRNSFQLGAFERLEAAIVGNEGTERLGEALASYYRMSDHAGNQLDFHNAPAEIQNLDLCMRDAAEALIRKTGVDPEIFNQLLPGQVRIPE